MLLLLSIAPNCPFFFAQITLSVFQIIESYMHGKIVSPLEFNNPNLRIFPSLISTLDTPP